MCVYVCMYVYVWRANLRPWQAISSHIDVIHTYTYIHTYVCVCVEGKLKALAGYLISYRCLTYVIRMSYVCHILIYMSYVCHIYDCM